MTGGAGQRDWAPGQEVRGPGRAGGKARSGLPSPKAPLGKHQSPGPGQGQTDHPRMRGHLRRGWGPECLRDCPPMMHTTRHIQGHTCGPRQTRTHMYTHIFMACTSYNDPGTQTPSQIVFRDIPACMGMFMHTYVQTHAYPRPPPAPTQTYATSTSTSRTVTFLGDELIGNSNLKCPKHRGMVTGDNIVGAT